MAKASVATSLDRLVAATPTGRNRVVDLVRAFSILVVVVWHWALSVNHLAAADRELRMPNPVEQVPYGWLATWLLQVMPIFFVVGGFSNLAGWEAQRRSDPDTPPGRRFLRQRVERLLRPTAVFVGVWAIAELALQLFLPDYQGVLTTAFAVFVPMWFLAAYLWVVLLVPVTARLHRRFGARVAVALGAAVGLVDVGRFALDLDWFGWVNTALVWVFAHQLGYFWRDGRLAARRRQLALTAGGLLALVVVTNIDVYPRSMVAQPDELSHMYPTTVGVAALATFQLGVVLLAAQSLGRWLRNRRPWTVVVALNSVILTIFLWHMTALLLFVLTLDELDVDLFAEPTAAWWAQRPLWLVGPAMFLAPLVAVFARIEQGGRSPARQRDV